MTQAQLSHPVTPSTKPLKAILNLCIALLAISFAPIFIRFSQIELGSNATVFNRSLIFLLVFGLGRSFSNYTSQSPQPPIKKSLSKSQGILLIMMGVFSLMSLGLWTYSLKHITVAKSMLLSNITPVFTALGGWLFFHQHFDYKFLLGMTIALSGAITLSSEDLRGGSCYLIGDLCALLSAIFRGGYFLTVEKLREHFDATTILIWRCLITCLLLLPIIFITEGQFFPTHLTIWLAVIGLGVISEGLGQRLLAQCMDQLSSSFIALFLLLEPMLSAVFAWSIFGESCSVITGIGFIIILTGIYLAQSSEAAIHQMNKS